MKKAKLNINLSISIDNPSKELLDKLEVAEIDYMSVNILEVEEADAAVEAESIIKSTTTTN